jgi:hypothetical protein
MGRFYDRSGVCFNGGATIEPTNGDKRVRDLMKGDVLIDGGIGECVVETVEDGAIRKRLSSMAFCLHHIIPSK